MTTKEKMLQAVQELPDDASVEDAMESLLVLAKIERGIVQADRGETVPHQTIEIGLPSLLDRTNGQRLKA